MTRTISAHGLYMREWRKKHPEAADYQRDYYKRYLSTEEGRQRNRERAKAWRLNNPERAAEKSRLWADSHRPRRTELHARWCANNRAQHLAYRRMDRAKRRAAEVDSGVTLEHVIVKSGMVCGICMHAIDGAFHVDHVHPLSKGGLHVIDNLQLAHPRCNQRKGASVDYK